MVLDVLHCGVVGIHRDLVHALVLIGVVFDYPERFHDLGRRRTCRRKIGRPSLPALTAIVRAEVPTRGDTYGHPIVVVRVEDDSVQAKAARARAPTRPGLVLL